MSYRLFEYKFVCPYCVKWTEGYLGGEHSDGYEIVCEHCRAVIDYDFSIYPSIKQRKRPKKY